MFKNVTDPTNNTESALYEHTEITMNAKEVKNSKLRDQLKALMCNESFVTKLADALDVYENCLEKFHYIS